MPRGVEWKRIGGWNDVAEGGREKRARGVATAVFDRAEGTWRLVVSVTVGCSPECLAELKGRSGLLRLASTSTASPWSQPGATTATSNTVGCSPECLVVVPCPHVRVEDCVTWASTVFVPRHLRRGIHVSGALLFTEIQRQRQHRADISSTSTCPASAHRTHR